jgi:ornithine cyclodeaminase/alanine dehydrogenase-like protein (mu-crystallin family)
MKLLVINSEQVVCWLPMSKCIELMTRALESLARGDVYLPLRTIVRPPNTPTVMALMPAHLSGKGTGFGVKTICVFPGNHALGKDSHQGAVSIFSGETGELLALVNASAVTAIRTAAVSAVATKLLAKKSASDLAIIGAGRQGRTHLAAMIEVRQIKRVRVTDIVFKHAKKFAAEMSADYNIAIEAVRDAETAVRNADIIVTVTTSHEPVLHREWISDGVHLNVVGGSVPQTREVDTATMAAAKLYVDRRESTLSESGDYLMAAKEGAIGPDRIQAEIGELLIGKGEGRTSDREITLFKALGLAVEDVAAAEYLYRYAKENSLGTWVEF